MAAKELFAEANAAFVEENYDEAVQLYNKAIEQDNTKDDFYVARACSHIKLENYDEAINDASRAFELNPQNAKSCLRKGIAEFHLHRYEEALNSFTKGLSIDGSEKNFSSWIRKCEAEIDLKQKKSTPNIATNEAPLNESSSDKPEDTTSQTTDSNPGNQSSSPQVEPPKHQSSSPQAEPPKPQIPMPSGPKTRYDWYQTETHVVITILVKNVKKEDLHTDIEEKSLGVSIQLPSGGEYSLQLDLCHTVIPAPSAVKILGSKVEIKLKKADGIRWTKLEADDSDQNVKQFNPSGTSDVDAAKKYPSSSHYTRDWDKIVTNIKKEEKDEKLEGDAAVNQLFQQIYADGNDDIRKAMNKSFVESGGTVLSTNWKDIKATKTDVKPPDGMEYKKYSS